MGWNRKQNGCFWKSGVWFLWISVKFEDLRHDWIVCMDSDLSGQSRDESSIDRIYIAIVQLN